MTHEIRVTVELLDERGDVVVECVVLAEPDDPGLYGDVEQAVDEILSEVEA